VADFRLIYFLSLYGSRISNNWNASQQKKKERNKNKQTTTSNEEQQLTSCWELCSSIQSGMCHQKF